MHECYMRRGTLTLFSIQCLSISKPIRNAYARHHPPFAIVVMSRSGQVMSGQPAWLEWNLNPDGRAHKGDPHSGRRRRPRPGR